MSIACIKQINLTATLICVLMANCSSDVAPPELSEIKKSDDPIVFVRVAEPDENAFTFLLPEGWIVAGGITRVNPDNAGGSGNAIEARLYMKVSSPDHKASMGWLPDTRFCDIRRLPVQNLVAPMFPDGSNYNGMMVMRLMEPDEFVANIALPFAHPHAKNIQVTSIEYLPQLAYEFAKIASLMPGGFRFNYKSAIVTFEYSESNIRYSEKMVCTIEDRGQAGSGVWCNTETWYVRSEKQVFSEMAPVFATVGQSVKLNPVWLSREVRNQLISSNINLQAQRDSAWLDKQITEHRSHTNSEINNIMFLDFTGQEDYTNPFTGETERGSNEWKYRWENERGDVVCHNDPNYNPEKDSDIQIRGFRRSEIRKR